MKWTSRTRCSLVCLAFVGLFTLFSFRLIYLQVVLHEEGLRKAAQQYGERVIIPAERGAIVDRNGEKLAHNLPAETVVADARRTTNLEALTALLADTLQLPFEDVAEKLSGDRRYVVLKRAVPMTVTAGLKEKLAAQDLRGILFEHDTSRSYPNGPMLCHVIGFTDFDHHGIQGVEKSMEHYLHGQDGYRYIEHNRAGKPLPIYSGEERAARDGDDVRLTIDLHLQNIVENEIDAAVREYRPEKAVIILMQPETGEILAMANRPNFNLNLRAGAKPEEMKNRAVIDMLEPGSTFKIVTAAAALNERKVGPESTIFCENGIWNYGGRPLHDHAAYGELSVQDILIKSSNIGAAKLAISVGEQKFYEYIRRFGFGERSGIELPGEIPGLVKPPRDWTPRVSITRIPMGQEVCVTPLQMTAAMAAIANGGKLMTPRIVRSITAADGRTIAEFKPSVLREVISPQTAAQISMALRGVVSDRGTAKTVLVPGFTICGKTGTAQKAKANGRGYEPGQYIVSFSGFLPAERPALVGIVILDNAKTATPAMNYGGTVAGPIFARIAIEAARYLDLEPHEEIRREVAVGQVALTNPARR